jgi:hypothetical protein
MSIFINTSLDATFWWEERRPNVIKICSDDERFVNDEGAKPGLWISVKRTRRGRVLWNRLARPLAAEAERRGRPGPPLIT